MREGRGNPAFWIRLEGTLVGPGGFVGDFSLLTARPAAATVRTLTRVRAPAASADQFRAVASDNLVRLRLRAAYADRYRDDLADALAAAS